MFVLADRLNGMFKDVGAAIENKDASVIQDIAKQQLAAGGNALEQVLQRYDRHHTGQKGSGQRSLRA